MEKERCLDPRKNDEGYLDLTAYEAIKRVEESTGVVAPVYPDPADMDERDRHHKLIGGILRMCELAGYSIEERIVVRDNRTGKVWR